MWPRPPVTSTTGCAGRPRGRRQPSRSAAARSLDEARTRAQRDRGLGRAGAQLGEDLIGDVGVRVDVDVREAQSGVLLRQHLRRADAERARRVERVVGVDAYAAPRDQQHRQRPHGRAGRSARARAASARAASTSAASSRSVPPGGAAVQQSMTPARRGSVAQTSAASSHEPVGVGRIDLYASSPVRSKRSPRVHDERQRTRAHADAARPRRRGRSPRRRPGSGVRRASVASPPGSAGLAPHRPVEPVRRCRAIFWSAARRGRRRRSSSSGARTGTSAG